MLIVALGKRYERLLLLTAPITLAAILVLIVALASSKQEGRTEARCNALAAKVFDANSDELNKVWRSSGPIAADKFWGIEYQSQLKLTFLHAAGTIACYDIVKGQLDRNYRLSPEALVKYFKGTATALAATPIEMYGVQLPNNPTIDLFGSEIRIELIAMTRILQVVLFPVLLLWLGSLYGTRYRETLLVGRSQSLADIFPHLINTYPATDFSPPLKRHPLAAHRKTITSTIFALVRIALLSIFVLPPVVAYLSSLYFMANEEIPVLEFFAGLLVSLFCFTTLVAEVLPQHFFKIFPDPTKE